MNINNDERDNNIYLSSDNKELIIEQKINISNKLASNSYRTNGSKILTKTENATNIIKTISYAWRYKKMYEEGIGIDTIRKKEKKKRKNCI